MSFEEKINSKIAKKPYLQRFDGEHWHNNYPNIGGYLKALEKYVLDFEADVLAEIRALHEKILKLRSITTSPMSYNDWIERKKVLALITSEKVHQKEPEK